MLKKTSGWDGTGYCSSQIVLESQYVAAKAYGTVWNVYGTSKHTCGDITTSTSECSLRAPPWEDLPPHSWWISYTFGRIAILEPKHQKNRILKWAQRPKVTSIYDHIPRPQTCTHVASCCNRIASWPLDLPNFAPLIPHWRAVAPTWLEMGRKTCGNRRWRVLLMWVLLPPVILSQSAKRAFSKQWWRRNGFKFQSVAKVLQDFKAKENSRSVAFRKSAMLLTSPYVPSLSSVTSSQNGQKNSMSQLRLQIFLHPFWWGPLEYSKKHWWTHPTHQHLCANRVRILSSIMSCLLNHVRLILLELYSRNLSIYPQICHHFIKFRSQREPLGPVPQWIPNLWGAGYSVQRDLVNGQDCWPRKTSEAG